MSSMLQIRDLLNPVTPEPSDASSDEACSHLSPGRAIAGAASIRHLVRPREWPSKPNRQRGPVNYMPFEEGLSPELIRRISLFKVRPFGQIRQSCEHIPYNSSKKDFFEKTGRESIDVLKYEFRSRGDNPGDFTVMWDYDVGLVRITPFFKCLGYAKTKPSQMLDKNPGLRDITPSITGGAVSAQECRAPGTPGYRDMTIEPRIIEEATREAKAARPMRMEPSPSFTPRPDAAPTPKPRHVLEPRPDQRSYERRPPGPECERLVQPSPQRVPSTWKAINGTTSPITPPRSANSQRPLLSGNLDRFQNHQYVEDRRHGLVLITDDSPEQRPALPQEFHRQAYPVTPVRLPIHTVEGYGLKRRHVSPAVGQFDGRSGDRDVRLAPRQEPNPHKRTQREGPRMMEDYRAARTLVGLQGEGNLRSRG
ncbi:hypothetical protein NLG97_g5888 [Lecanicillium saksenae]|uniref:Uncharacterized protein n=1 Tax=Lecanicillium saksenae TaxID=468837 RepID=A0ACC1QTK3_9HYPO|nr:hypothetical protein NLG97_g5888 [Lecanicillium saksenae]